MGMDPATLGAIIAAGGAIASHVTAPQGQKLSSFEGDPVLDPRTTLKESKAMLESVFGPAALRALQAPDMSDAYVQNVPQFTGGALPMPIGVSGSWGANKPVAAAHDDTLPKITLKTASDVGGSGGQSLLGTEGAGAGAGQDPTGGPTADPTGDLSGLPSIGSNSKRTTASAGASSSDFTGGSGLDDLSSFGSTPLSLLSGNGPVRKTAGLPADAGQGTQTQAQGLDTAPTRNSATTDPRAMGAVSLLLQLAQATPKSKPTTGAV